MPCVVSELTCAGYRWGNKVLASDLTCFGTKHRRRGETRAVYSFCACSRATRHRLFIDMILFIPDDAVPTTRDNNPGPRDLEHVTAAPTRDT